MPGVHSRASPECVEDGPQRGDLHLLYGYPEGGYSDVQVAAAAIWVVVQTTTGRQILRQLPVQLQGSSHFSTRADSDPQRVCVRTSL